MDVGCWDIGDFNGSTVITPFGDRAEPRPPPLQNADVRRRDACDLPRDSALHEGVVRHGILQVERVLVLPSNEKAIYFFLGPETLGNNLAIW